MRGEKRGMSVVRATLRKVKGRRNRFWLRRKWFWKRETLLPVAFLAAAGACFGAAAVQGTTLGIAMGEPLQLRVAMPLDASAVHASGEEEIFASVEQITSLSSVREWTATLCWQDYRTEVIVSELEYDYLVQRYGDSFALPYSDTLRYVIVPEETLSAMRTKQLEHLDTSDSVRNYEGEIFQLVVGEEETEPVRIWGIPGSTSDTEDRAGNQAEKAIDEIPKIYAVLPESEKTNAGSEYLLDLSSGFSLKSVAETLENSGMVLLSAEEMEDVSALLDQWKETRTAVIRRCLTGILSLCCGLIVIFYQRRLWALEHKELILYLKQFER